MHFLRSAKPWSAFLRGLTVVCHLGFSTTQDSEIEIFLGLAWLFDTLNSRGLLCSESRSEQRKHSGLEDEEISYTYFKQEGGKAQMSTSNIFSGFQRGTFRPELQEVNSWGWEGKTVLLFFPGKLICGPLLRLSKQQSAHVSAGSVTTGVPTQKKLWGLLAKLV